MAVQLKRSRLFEQVVDVLEQRIRDRELPAGAELPSERQLMAEFGVGRTAIREAFQRADRPLSPEEVLSSAQTEVEGLSIATVYRNIGSLLEIDWLTTVSMPGETLRYEVAGKAHHHHFRCNGCGKVFELQGCELNSHPRLPRGFRATGHEFFLFGSCADCV